MFRKLLTIAILTLVPGKMAFAEDAQDIRGNKHGCKDVTATGAWDSITSADLENQSGSTALASGLYWTELLVKSGSATVYVCEAAGTSCGTGTGNKLSVASGAVIVLPLRGLNTTSVAIYATAATTVQVCGYFRANP